NPVEEIERFLPRAFEVYGAKLEAVDLYVSVGDEDSRAAWALKKEGVAKNWLGPAATWGLVKGAYKLDVAEWLDSAQKGITDRILRQSVDWRTFDVRTFGWHTADLKKDFAGFDHVVCAEGWRIAENPLWRGLEWKPARGDSIRVQADDSLNAAFDDLVAKIRE